ncbi:MotA/TolQ/ExbB proton channel family protein, partial [Gilvimarinus sp. 1_MG-2023]
FMTGVLVKLGLLGTVVGFMLMLGSVSGLENLDTSDLKVLMQQMTTGMGVAMNTTLVGLVCSILLGLQYLLLDRSADRLVA